MFNALKHAFIVIKYDFECIISFLYMIVINCTYLSMTIFCTVAVWFTVKNVYEKRVFFRKKYTKCLKQAYTLKSNEILTS